MTLRDLLKRAFYVLLRVQHVLFRSGLRADAVYPSLLDWKRRRNHVKELRFLRFRNRPTWPDEDHDLYKHPRWWISDRWCFLVATTSGFLHTVFRRRKLQGISDLCVAMSPDERNVDYVKRFFDRIDDTGIATVGLCDCSGVLLPPEKSKVQFRMLWSLFSQGFTSALLAFFDFSGFPYTIYAAAHVAAVRTLCWANDVDRVYLHYLYDPRMYIMAVALSRCLTGKVFLVYHEQLLSFYAAYSAIDASVIVDTRLQKYIAEHLLVDSSVNSPNALYRDYFELYPEKKPQLVSPQYDIAFISSGNWARPGFDGRYSPEQFAVLRGIQENELCDVGQKEISLLRHLIVYAEKHHMKLRILPHPYERRIRAAGIEMIWEQWVDGETVLFDSNDESDSLNAAVAARAVVSMASTLNWWLLQAGFTEVYNDASFFDGDGGVALSAMGPYRKHFYNSFEHLDELLDTSLGYNGLTENSTQED